MESVVGTTAASVVDGVLLGNALSVVDADAASVVASGVGVKGLALALGTGLVLGADSSPPLRATPARLAAATTPTATLPRTKARPLRSRASAELDGGR